MSRLEDIWMQDGRDDSLDVIWHILSVKHDLSKDQDACWHVKRSTDCFLTWDSFQNNRNEEVPVNKESKGLSYLDASHCDNLVIIVHVLKQKFKHLRRQVFELSLTANDKVVKLVETLLFQIFLQGEGIHVLEDLWSQIVITVSNIFSLFLVMMNFVPSFGRAKD